MKTLFPMFCLFFIFSCEQKDSDSKKSEHSLNYGTHAKAMDIPRCSEQILLLDHPLHPQFPKQDTIFICPKRDAPYLINMDTLIKVKSIQNAVTWLRTHYDKINIDNSLELIENAHQIDLIDQRNIENDVTIQYASIPLGRIVDTINQVNGTAIATDRYTYYFELRNVPAEPSQIFFELRQDFIVKRINNSIPFLISLLRKHGEKAVVRLGHIKMKEVYYPFMEINGTYYNYSDDPAKPIII